MARATRAGGGAAPARDGVEIVFQTRFSFFGQSGWRSEASADPERLFAPDRLAARLDMFDAITLPALAAQTDPAFRHVVLTSDLMPAPFLDHLGALCRRHLGPERVRVMVRAPGSAGAEFRRDIRNRHAGAATVAQVVLDDDDALSADFTATLRAEVAAARSVPGLAEGAFIVSFPDGVTMDLSAVMEGGAPVFSDRSVPFTNLGMALVAPAASKFNPYMTAHKRVARRFATRVLSNRLPYYVRTVHGLNDSRAMTGETPVAPAALAGLRARFPGLLPFIDRAAAAMPAAARPEAAAAATPADVPAELATNPAGVPAP